MCVWKERSQRGIGKGEKAHREARDDEGKSQRSDVLATSEAVPSVGGLPQLPLLNNPAITDLAVFPAPLDSDPWHIAHARVCAHATQVCVACSAAFVCCSCRALRFTPGTAPVAPSPTLLRRSRSSSPALFRDVGNGPSPLGFNDSCPQYDDDAYTRALAECDTCDNSSCPRGTDEPATYSITVDIFDEGNEETYERIFRACGACNRSCKKSFMGYRIKSRTFDNSTREAIAKCRQSPPTAAHTPVGKPELAQSLEAASHRVGPIPGSIPYEAIHCDPGNPPMTPWPL